VSVELTSKQRSHLKALAHHLKPLQHIGKEGISDRVIASVLEALNQRELIKVKVQEASPQSAREAGQIFAERLEDVAHVQTIGRTVVLYRRHPEKPEIVLPA
jgi:RNA-binding protein